MPTGAPTETAAQAQLIEAYERVYFPIPTPDAITAIEFRMAQEGLDRLAPWPEDCCKSSAAGCRSC